MLQDHDYFNNQFTLESYLNTSIINFAKKENLDINYVCFLEAVKDDTKYLLTTNITRKPGNGYRLITITKITKDDTIIDYRRFGSSVIELEVIYNGTSIRITKAYDNILNIHIEESVRTLFLRREIIKGHCFNEIIATYNPSTRYDKNIKIPNNKVISIVNLNHFDNRYLSKFYNQQIRIECGRRFSTVDMTTNLNITEITLYHHYNKPIIGFPLTLKKITFGYTFNSDSGIFPESCEEIIFGCRFNQILKVLPKSLKKLTFGAEYNQIIEKDILGSCLIELSFGKNFQQSIKGILPKSLEILKFKGEYRIYVDKEDIPRKLQQLRIPRRYCLIDKCWGPKIYYL